MITGARLHLGVLVSDLTTHGFFAFYAHQSVKQFTVWNTAWDFFSKTQQWNRTENQRRDGRGLPSCEVKKGGKLNSAAVGPQGFCKQVQASREIQRPRSQSNTPEHGCLHHMHIVQVETREDTCTISVITTELTLS